MGSWARISPVSLQRLLERITASALNIVHSGIRGSNCSLAVLSCRKRIGLNWIGLDWIGLDWIGLLNNPQDSSSHHEESATRLSSIPTPFEGRPAEALGKPNTACCMPALRFILDSSRDTSYSPAGDDIARRRTSSLSKSTRISLEGAQSVGLSVEQCWRKEKRIATSAALAATGRLARCQHPRVPWFA